MRVTARDSSHELMEFDSIADLRSEVEGKHSDAEVLRHIGEGEDYMGDVKSWDHLTQLARDGWEDDVEELVKVSEETLETIDREFQLPSWQSYYDVTGSDVDVARYLSGEPENMIAYTMVETPRVGRVITLAVNVGASGIVDSKVITARGKYIVSLVYALESMGLRTELYADLQAKGWGRGTCRTLVKVKAADDVLDPAMIMFAYAHPAFMRAYMLASMHGFSEGIQVKVGVGSGYGVPTKGFDDQDILPEGTVTVASNMTGAWNKQDAQDFVVKHLRELGIIS